MGLWVRLRVGWCLLWVFFGLFVDVEEHFADGVVLGGFGDYFADPVFNLVLVFGEFGDDEFFLGGEGHELGEEDVVLVEAIDEVERPALLHQLSVLFY